MGKKVAKKPAAEEATKAAFQVRLDRDLYDKLSQASEESSASLNQIIQGICRAAMEAYSPGRPVIEEGEVKVVKQAGCLFFGRVANWDLKQAKSRAAVKAFEELGEVTDEDDARANEEFKAQWLREFEQKRGRHDPGSVWFWLDFSERGNVHIPQA